MATELGFSAEDAGSLPQARVREPFAMLWITLAMVRGYRQSERGAAVENAGLGPIATVVLGTIEGLIGCAKERFSVNPWTIGGVAEAGRDRKESGTGGDGFTRDGGAHSLRQGGQFRRGFRGDD